MPNKEWIESVGFSNKAILIESIVKKDNPLILMTGPVSTFKKMEQYLETLVPGRIYTYSYDSSTIGEFLKKYLEKEIPGKVVVVHSTSSMLHPVLCAKAVHIDLEYPSTIKAKAVLDKVFNIADEFDKNVALRLNSFNVDKIIDSGVSELIIKKYFLAFIYLLHDKLPKDILWAYDRLESKISDKELYTLVLTTIKDLIYMKRGKLNNTYVPSNYLENVNMDRLLEMYEITEEVIESENFDILDVGNLYCSWKPSSDEVSEQEIVTSLAV